MMLHFLNIINKFNLFQVLFLDDLKSFKKLEPKNEKSDGKPNAKRMKKF